MSNISIAKSKVLLRAFFVAMTMVSFVASCGSGSAAVAPRAAPIAGAVGNSTIIVNLTAEITKIAYNGNTNVHWSSSNSSSCTSTGGGGTGTSGTFNTGALTATTAYTVACTGRAGGSLAKSITITVDPSVINDISDAGSGNVIVTSDNALTNGLYISISGTTSYNGNYVVSNVTPKSFTIPHNYLTNDKAGTWQLTGGMIAGCPTTGATDAISLSIVPSRFTGVAPLSVFFDATGTTATPTAQNPTPTTQPFHDLEYRWEDDLGNGFGDPGSGTWGDKTSGSSGSGANTSRNIARGAVASHVYEQPGVYTVTLRVTDGTNTVSNSCVRIVALDPNVEFAGTKTICFANGTDFTECPFGATPVTTSNFSTAVSTYQASGRRLLFRRGDTFDAAAVAIINKTGPGIIGAFGSATAAPIVKATTTSIFQLSSPTTPGIKDWRIVDLDLDMQKVSSGPGITSGGGINQLLLLRTNILNASVGLLGDPMGLDYNNNNGHPGHTVFDEWTIQDSTYTPVVGTMPNAAWRIYVAGKRIAIQGNYLDNMDTGGSHVIRNNQLINGIISHNTLVRAGSYNHLIKLHAWGWTAQGVCNPSGTGTYTEKVVIADNKLVGGINPWSVSIEPQNDTTDERIKDVIVERNWFTSGTGTSVQLMISAISVTARNNIFDLSNGSAADGVNVGRRGLEPHPDNVKIYNNTFYSSTTNTHNEFSAVVLDSTDTNITVVNNLAYAPLFSSPAMINGSVASGLIQSTNSTNTQVRSTAPGWVSSSPANPAGFKLTTDSYARGIGTAIPLYSDFFLQSRKSNDLGATEP